MLGVAALLPLAVHLLPGQGMSVGVALLPMFWTGLVAVYFFGWSVGVVVAAFGPLINLLVTGWPAGAFLLGMTAENVVFIILCALMIARWPRFFAAAPLGYILSRTLVGLRSLHAGSASVQFASWERGLERVWPGILVLLTINLALVYYYPKLRQARS